MFKKYTIIAMLVSIILIWISGCGDVNCRPDAKLENKEGDWYAGIFCGGSF